MAVSDDIESRFAEACALAARGRNDEARQAYLDLLAKVPDHAGALNNLGTLLWETGYRSAARTAYAEAAARHPGDPVSQVNFGNLLLAEGDAVAARLRFEATLAVSADHAEAHRGLAYCLDELGEPEAAQTHRDAAFKGRAITKLPYRGDGAGVPLLLLVAARGGNIPTRFLIDDRVFATTVLVADYADPSVPLPEHRLVFNTIGDVDLVGDAVIEAARAIVARSSAPVVNRPEHVIGTGRADIAKRLSAIPGLRAPKVALLSRDAIVMAGLGYPLLLRAPGFHTGRHFLRADNAIELALAAAKLPGTELLAIEYLDARGSDGLWRKYRAMMIGGKLYPLHMAASRDWKVHYFSSAMADAPNLRAEEARFLADMPGAVGAKAMAALEAVMAELGLDYAGIDFGLASDGTVLLFEANATMVINPPESDPRWDYRRMPIQRALDAARGLLAARAGIK